MLKTQHPLTFNDHDTSQKTATGVSRAGNISVPASAEHARRIQGAQLVFLFEAVWTVDNAYHNLLGSSSCGFHWSLLLTSPQSLNIVPIALSVSGFVVFSTFIFSAISTFLLKKLTGTLSIGQSEMMHMNFIRACWPVNTSERTNQFVPQSLPLKPLFLSHICNVLKSRIFFMINILFGSCALCLISFSQASSWNREQRLFWLLKT